jgi:diguanylate cyclase (GGDEF)-like protein
MTPSLSALGRAVVRDLSVLLHHYARFGDALDRGTLGRLKRLPALWRSQTHAVRDLFIIAASTVVFAGLISATEACTAFFEFVHDNPDMELDSAILAGMSATIGLMIFSLRRWRELKREVKFRIFAEKRVHELAYHDPLTGLYNRRALADELARVVSRTKRSKATASVLMLDLDRFKPVNDLYGHGVGDALLTAVAERLKVELRAEEFLARLGGDEFAVVLAHDSQDTPAAGAVAERLAEAFKAPFKIGHLEVSVGLTIGIAHCPSDAGSPDQLMHCADVALYEAKAQSRGGHCTYAAQMGEQLKLRSETELELRAAIAGGEIVPFFQPLVDLADGRIVGFEALARWPRPGKPASSPAFFIPIAEECGLINELSLSILRQSCIAANAWDPSISLSVNLSPLQFADPWLAEKVLAILVETGFRPQRLEIEITETAFAKDMVAAKRILTSLKNQGVRVSLDDFGAGYSSLQHLGSMQFDKIKIDRSFILTRHDNPEGEKIVNAIIGLSKSLGLTTTGEGIETQENADWLQGIGCTFGQGWHFGRPIAAADVAELVRKSLGETEQVSAA